MSATLQRLRALIVKEFGQIRRDRRLVMSLIVPPVLQLTLFGFALSATVSNLRLGVVDESGTPQSRELVATLTQSRSFRLGGYYPTVDHLGTALSEAELDAGVVGVLANYNGTLRRAGVTTTGDDVASVTARRRAEVHLMPAFLYNPGLVDSWFVATGVFGLLLILNSSLISSAAMVREREAGTIEQLIMSPASTGEIIVAKIAPLFVLLCLMMLLAVAVLKLVFRVPFRGSLLFVLLGGVLCILSGISLGTVIATFSRSAQQAQLTAFFINPPLSSLSGALNPVEAMPAWLQPLTVLNPIHHFATIVRGSLLRGTGLETLWPNVLGLLIFTLVLVTLSTWRFRKQLS